MHPQDSDQEIVADFLVEAWEQLEQLDREFVALEEQPHTAKERVNTIFRAMHTLKGGAGFLGLSDLEGLAHHAENLLSRLREGVLEVTAERSDLLLRTADAIKAILNAITVSGLPTGPSGEHTALISELQRSAEATPQPAATTQPMSEPRSQIDEYEELQAALMAALDTPAPSSTPAPAPREVEEAAPAAAAAVETERQADSRVRVHVDLLDKLMNLVGELVLSRNQILQVSGQLESGPLTSACQRINLVTSELQEHIMQTRMQPISTLLNRFPRLVRDLASQLGKEVRFTSEGQDTGLDRTILEAINDPLTHILRNSIDHGLEKPDVRQRGGKSTRGTIHVRAYHEGGQVTIEVHDDGAGIDLERVRAKAVQQRLVEESQARRMSERDTLQLLFRAGFSTAEQVTNLSGRGVGMDVVRASVERIGGTVDLTTVPGQGTCVKLRIPLTLAIIPALMVAAGGECYAIPQVSLQELVRLEGPEARSAVETLYGAEVYRLRGELLPLLRLRTVLGLPEREDDGVNIVVVSADGSPFGLIVDSVLDTEEIVVKPLSRTLKQLQLYAGATIMGDGRVALILDMGGMARSTRLQLDPGESELKRGDSHGSGDGCTNQSLLLFTLGGPEQFAIPLTLISRLEEFPSESIEEVGNRQLVQYRGRLLPLLDLAQHLGRCANYSDDSVQRVLVCSHGERDLGLMVGEIRDVVDHSGQVDFNLSESSAVLGTAVLDGKATTIIDLYGVVQHAEPDWLQPQAAQPAARKRPHVLVADDSSFFASLTTSYLQTAGCTVSVARELSGLPERIQRESFDAVVLEAGMPHAKEALQVLTHPGLSFRGKVMVTAQRGALPDCPSEHFSPVYPYTREALLRALDTEMMGATA